jgi:hypothetical protein
MAGENGGGSGVKEAFEGIDAEGIGDGNFVFARNEERADRFARAAQKKDGGESGQGHFIDVPKTGRPEMLLEIPPADGAEEVAKINQDEGEKNVGEVGAFDGEPELLATEIAQIEEVAGAIEEEAISAPPRPSRSHFLDLAPIGRQRKGRAGWRQGPVSNFISTSCIGGHR